MKTANNLFIAFLILTAVVGYDIAHTPTPAPKIDIYVINSGEKQAIEPTTISQGSKIEAYIKQKFGRYSTKAFILLQGKGEGTCAENRNLDPNAVNNNTIWGGVGRDCGVFQVNDVYHPFSCEQLKDYKTNIDYAYRMFVNDNHTFTRWTCGKYYGI